jgi:LPXTG-motif cell wall-anchored protein
VPVILIVVAGVILLLLAMLFIRSRRKSVAWFRAWQSR